MRIAAIDIGTNSVHMIVVRVRSDLSFEVIDREKVMVRLGAGGLDGKALTTDAMNAALQALSKFKRLAESHRVDEILAAATSATREARNGGEFLARVERETGIRPRVITGTSARSAQVSSCSVAAARKVSAAASSTFLPYCCFRRCASLAISVVLPAPLTPTTSRTYGCAWAGGRT